MLQESLSQLLAQRFAAAIATLPGAPAEADPLIRPAQDARFGDYQCNAAMGLAKLLGLKPREVAERIIAAVALQDIAGPLEIAGPGFINIRLKTEFLAASLGDADHARLQPPRAVSALPHTGGCRPSITTYAPAGGDRLGIGTTAQPQRVIVDYSSPNIAKEMHVGHIRSTILGDVLVRVLAFQGHEVVRQNHVGDWGTQMGMVILGIWHVYRLRHTPAATSNAAMLACFEAGLCAVDAKAEPRARLAYLENLAREMSAALHDPAAQPPWPAWLSDFEAGRTSTRPELPLLTAAYRFVNAVEDAPEAASIAVSDPGRSRDIPLARLSNHVVAEMLHAEHAEELHAWRIARDVSISHAQSMYDRLGVLLRPEDACGESFYHERLPAVVAGLRERLPPRDKNAPADGPYAELRSDRGATCVFFYDAAHQPRFKGPTGDELPLLVQKSDGAFLYATTDLAAVRYRVDELQAQRIIYITDARQVQHFQQFFAAARAAGWAPAAVSLEHVTFGSVLGEDRKPLKTRSGRNVTLRDLLDEAEERALALVRQRAAENPEGPRLSEAEQQHIARVVGVAAVKYADLKNDRKTDYLFSWDKMLALQGNTAPYLLYAYTRLRSILREAADRGSPLAPTAALLLDHAAERALALRVLRLRETLTIVAQDLTPHVLCTYLYDLASDLTQFYEACPVLKAPSDAIRASRLRLCDLAARTLRLGLNFLGIEPLERM